MATERVDGKVILAEGIQLLKMKIVEFSPKIAKPFMMPARDAHASETRNAVIDAIRKAAREGFK